MNCRSGFAAHKTMKAVFARQETRHIAERYGEHEHSGRTATWSQVSLTSPLFANSTSRQYSQTGPSRRAYLHPADAHAPRPYPGACSVRDIANLCSPLKPIALTTASATSSTPTERMSGSTSSYLRRTNAKSFARSREYIVCPSRFKFAASQTMKGVLFSADTQTVR